MANVGKGAAIPCMVWGFICNPKQLASRQPGWPTTMPTGFDEWVAYDLMTAVVESPMKLGM